jgi:CRISPR-associated protein Csy1
MINLNTVRNWACTKLIKEKEMLDPAISRFFEEQKSAWLSDNAKKLEGEALQQKINECAVTFDITTWLTANAPKAIGRAITSHPSKFSHPDTGVGKTNVKKGTYVTPVLFSGERLSDGLLRTGNVDSIDVDSVGDAGALKIESFLKIKIDSDGRTLIAHLLEDTGIAYELYKYAALDKDWLKNNLLAGIDKANDTTVFTNSRIKQVYFPAEADYHQLSLLTNSGIIFELRQRLDAMRFGDEVKAKRALKKANQYSEQGYSEIYDITTIGYGGNNPQNISLLNTKHRGETYLLSSIPPVLKARNVRFPKANFFAEALTIWHFKELFQALHDVLKIEIGGNIPRQKLLTARDNTIKALVLKIMDTVYLLREASIDQYRESTGLTAAQQIWLYHENCDKRENTDLWLEEIIHDMTFWLNNAYSKLLGDKQILLGSEEFNEIKKIIGQWVAENKEFLR